MAKIQTNKSSGSNPKKNQPQNSDLPSQGAAQNNKGRYNDNPLNVKNASLNPDTNKTGAKPGVKSATASKGAQGQKKQSTLEDLFESNLKDMYSAEKQLIEALPEMANAAYSEDLRDAFNEHLQQTRRHAERIEKIFQTLRISKSEENKCEAMEGLIKEGQEIIEEFEEGYVRDSALIIGAQKIEHYEIASYGSLCELADVLGFTKIEDILDRTLEEEETTDRNLTKIAMNVNDDAYDASQGDSGDEME